MGRHSTGATTVNQCLQININYFLKHLPIKPYSFAGTTSWSNGASISFLLTNDNAGIFLLLNYSKTDQGKSQDIQYKVRIQPTPSNLGKGKNYYFICPFTSQQCKILYMAYGSNYFKCRKAYQHRIYYPSQLSSRLNLNNDKYWNIERSLEKLYIKHPKSHYKGLVTRPQKRIEQLENKKNMYDELRWQVLPVSLLKFLKKNSF